EARPASGSFLAIAVPSHSLSRRRLVHATCHELVEWMRDLRFDPLEERKEMDRRLAYNGLK
ncbi:MAG: hypothetical protein O7C75_16540, partial [Verrucomicrobia bacterium]|nr:hypothetical protein [Verrucomicrobiota bacterium]